MDFKALSLIMLFVVFVYQLLLRYLAWKSVNNPIPPNVADVYDLDTVFPGFGNESPDICDIFVKSI